LLPTPEGVDIWCLRKKFTLFFVMDTNIYNLAFLRSHDIILIADCEHRIIEANPSAIRIFGYSKEEFLSMNLGQMFSDKKHGSTFLKDICKQNLVNLKEYEFQKKNGKTFPVLVNADVVEPESDTFMMVAKDVSRYKKEKEDHYTRKEMMLLGKMAQTIAHDLKNPLNNLLLGLHQFQTALPEDNEEVSFYLNFLKKNANRINELINTLLGPSAIFNLQKERIDLNLLVKEAVKGLEDKIQSADVILKLDLSEAALYFELDKEKVLMALNNLIINAIESIHQDEGVIYIRTRQKEGGKASIMISDNGQGISESDMKNIYQPFYTTKSRGMGLGLVNTEQILNAHEVEIEARSEVSKGSTFTLNF